MNRYLRWFCWLVLQLDRIPRYGRYYTLDAKTHTIAQKPEWKFDRWGRWGMNILFDMNLFSRYIDQDEWMDL